MKLWERVNNVTGHSSKARFLVEHLNAGAKFLVASLPEKFLWTIASEVEVDGWSGAGTDIGGDGSPIAYDKILAVYRHDIPYASGAGTEGDPYVKSVASGKKRICAEAPDKNIHIFDESSSLLSATAMFPKFYKLAGKIFIKPDPDYNLGTDAKKKENLEVVEK